MRIDPDDLGWISVQINRVWKTIPCATSGLEGASIHGWLSVVQDQRRRHAIAAAPSRPIIADALRQIRAIAAKAERRLSIAPHTYDADAIAREEAEMLRGFDIPEDAARNALAPAGDPLANGIPVTGPTTPKEVQKASVRKRGRKADPPPDVPPPPEHGDNEGGDEWTMETPDE